ncbi:MAG: response regulator transcription factor, partial [Peptococcaceae bacterium]|nr:response regulator transcription factor [Peptococcaceae bacterium]
MNLKVMIAEDDVAMSQVIMDSVLEISGIEVVGVAANGIVALEVFERLLPQVVVVDIDLPGMDGLALAKEIFEINPWTYLVFCTGFPDYRAEAFELYAFDYLVKPFRMDRIKQTLGRIIKLESNKIKPIAPNESAVKNWALNQGTRIFRDTDKIVMLNLKEIIFFTKEDRKTVAYYDGGKVAVEETLALLEDKLRDQMFYRAHKGFLINLPMIREFVP